MAELERFNQRDVMQIAVGCFTGALTFSLSVDLFGVADNMGLPNVLLVVAISLISASVISYNLGIRRIGGMRKRYIFYFVPLRTAVHYTMAVLSSVFLLYALGLNTLDTPVLLAVKRVILLALPATVFGTAVDLIDSQKIG